MQFYGNKGKIDQRQNLTQHIFSVIINGNYLNFSLWNC